MTEVSTDTAGAHPSHQVVLEGWLLKRGNRRGWHKRYFVLSGNELSYYEQREDVKPKGTFTFSESEQSSCAVSDIYMRQRQKDKAVVYCVKTTWWSKKDSKPDASLNASRTEPLEATSSRPSTPVLSRSNSRKLSRTPTDPTRVSDSSWKHGPPDASLTDSLPSELLEQALAEKRTPEGRHFPSTPFASMTKPRPISRRGRSLPPLTPSSRTASPLQPPEVSLPRTPPSSPNSSSEVAVQEKDNGIQKHFNQQKYEQDEKERLAMHSIYVATKKASQKKMKKKIVKGGKIAAAAGAVAAVGVLTAGVGVVAGLIFVGAGVAAGGTGVAAEHQSKRKKGKELIIASMDYEEAKRWKSVLDVCLASESVSNSTWGQMFAMEGRSTTTCMLPTTRGITTVKSNDSAPSGEERLRKYRSMNGSTSRHQPGSHWRPIEGGWATLLGAGVHGLRIFREERVPEPFSLRSVDSHPCPPLKSQAVLNASPLNAFMCLMSLNRFPSCADFESPLSGQRSSFRLIESMDDHMDVIHLVFRPLFLFPSWTKPRDFVLFRYWRLQDDGTYLVCYDAVQHRKCPPNPSYVRGEMHAVFTIAPRKEVRKKPLSDRNAQASSELTESLLTAVVQVEPRGWVPTYPLSPLADQGYGEAFGVSALLQILDIRDALDHDRFVSVPMGNHHPGSAKDHLPFSPSMESRQKLGRPISSDDVGYNDDDESDYDFSYSERESVASPRRGMAIMSNPSPLTMDKWAQPDANSFRVRGKTYKTDRKKVNAGSSIGRLIAVDVVQVAKNFFTGFCAHPKERMQVALQRDRQRIENGLASDLPPFIFCVNVCLPGPPCYHGVFYFAIDDMSTIDGSNGTPESKLANQFIFGPSDEMRKNTFKLIPQIVKGNFLVRKAVGSTPAIMGTKLRQLYVRGERFFEVVLDCGSDPVAAGVIRLALGYAKTLVIDMGFLLEGNDEESLPEKILGCARIKELDFGPHLRFVEPPQDDSSE